MKNKEYMRALFLSLSSILFLCSPAKAQDFMGTLSNINNVFYGTVAGIAVVMLAFQAIKYKTAQDPRDRDEAKRGVIMIIIGLILAALAGAAVNILISNNPSASGGYNGVIVKMSTTSEKETTRRISTTARTATTSAGGTTGTLSPYLIPESLAKCIKSKGDLYSAGSGCPNCVRQLNVFSKDTAGNGQYWYTWMSPGPGPAPDRTCQCTVYPCWCYKSGTAIDNCHTFSELNTFWGCGLICSPGYTYYDCNGAGSTMC
jgi:hypothetical protein